jgi:hypothetical protein
MDKKEADLFVQKILVLFSPIPANRLLHREGKLEEIVKDVYNKGYGHGFSDTLMFITEEKADSDSDNSDDSGFQRLRAPRTKKKKDA